MYRFATRHSFNYYTRNNTRDKV